jgi:hypothetical protein
VLKLALRPTILARERFYADTRASATRQRTLEANGIDCGASGLPALTPRAIRLASKREGRTSRTIAGAGGTNRPMPSGPGTPGRLTPFLDYDWPHDSHDQTKSLKLAG